ncbi:MAG: phage major tail tube protein [Oscillospiraceae bacterium]|nr:phage major tail tube protein [Oscillospiraceae bacterium]
MVSYEVVTINFMVYEGKNRFAGAASVQLPNINQKTVNLSGAGIAGDVEVPISGQLEAMEVSIKFNEFSAEVARLRSPGRHTITLMPAVQRGDKTKGEIVTVPEKHTMVIVPKGLSGANIAPATQRESTLTASVRYWKYTVDGKTVHEIDPMNHIFIINGVDHGKAVRKALGL